MYPMTATAMPVMAALIDDMFRRKLVSEANSALSYRI